MKTPMAFCWFILVCTTAAVMASDTTNSVVESKGQKIKRLMQITGARQIARQSAYQIIGQFRENQPDLPKEFWDEFLSETNLDELFGIATSRSEEHTSELQSRQYLVCR